MQLLRNGADGAQSAGVLQTLWARVKEHPLSRLGPGLITGVADDDPSGIATYSQAGAQFGLNMLWTMPLAFPLMAAIQSICARIGRVTTLMVCLQLGHSNAALLKTVGDIAERFRATVIGIVACQPMRSLYTDCYVPADLIEQEHEEIKKNAKAAESEFRTALQARGHDMQFRSMMVLDPLCEYIANEARSADLVITNMNRGSLFDQRDVNVGDLVMRVGRPVLIVPPTLDALKFDRVVVGWKDTREARRAVVDALPFLKEVARVSIVEIADANGMAEARQRLEDVDEWFKHHGVVADVFAKPAGDGGPAQLNAIAAEQKADLIVAGAYGHSRLREWAFGGVTRDILLHADRCSLVSH
jgi:nucleotide-binding universal stress UspA family protein